MYIHDHDGYYFTFQLLLISFNSLLTASHYYIINLNDCNLENVMKLIKFQYFVNMIFSIFCFAVIFKGIYDSYKFNERINNQLENCEQKKLYDESYHSDKEEEEDENNIISSDDEENNHEQSKVENDEDSNKDESEESDQDSENEQ